MNEERQEVEIGQDLVSSGLKVVAVGEIVSHDDLRPVGKVGDDFARVLVVFGDVDFKNGLVETGEGFVGQSAVEVEEEDVVPKLCQLGCEYEWSFMQDLHGDGVRRHGQISNVEELLFWWQAAEEDFWVVARNWPFV